MSAAYFEFSPCLFVVCFLPDVSKVKKKKQQTPSSATVMELVSTKRQGVTKQVKRLQGRLGPGKSKATVKDKRIKSAVGQSILNHNTGRQSRNRLDRPAKKAKETQSVFTEEEFQQFQKEYFGRTVEDEK
uniref:Active regulator of SIRT1 n=1 Tax=Amphilophus citrinellus TaxID=61819 RepID=A0A3Q0R5C4_AMPCI